MINILFMITITVITVLHFSESSAHVLSALRNTKLSGRVLSTLRNSKVVGTCTVNFAKHKSCRDGYCQ